MPRLGDRTPVAERFWAKVDRRGPDECWPWLAYINHDGYGTFWNGKKVIGAHRESLILDGRDPGGGETRHICNNRRCVNPKHLIPGTHFENILDSIRDGTHISINNIPPRGEAHYNASLSGGKIRAIRIMALAGAKYREIGDHFGVSASVVHACVSGVRWKHLAMPIVISSFPANLSRARGPAKLSDDDIKNIRTRRAAGERLKTLAADFQVSQAAISLCARRITYSD